MNAEYPLHVKAENRFSSTISSRMSSKRFRQWTTKAFVYLALTIFGVAFLFPLIWMLLTALKTNDQIFGDVWLPNPIVWRNFPDAVKHIRFGQYALNTIFVCAVDILGMLFSCTLTAYGFARIKWPGRNVLFAIMLSTLMLPFQATMVPLYILFRSMNLVGRPGLLHYAPLLIPPFFGSAFFIFLLRQFFMGIPEDLADAARCDGAGELGILWRVIVPLSKPAIVTVALLSFMWTWNDFLWPLIVIHDEFRYTLSLGLQQYAKAHGYAWGLLCAAATIVVTPVIILFLFAQRTFIEGITLTGIKG